jgi:Lrp/AsnC family transcriptional regulator, leucine-responsive regulatory protein
MDAIDRKIFALYQHDTRRVAASIGAEVGLSAAAVQRRLKRLKSNGTIATEIAVLNNVAVATDYPSCEHCIGIERGAN